MPTVGGLSALSHGQVVDRKRLGPAALHGQDSGQGVGGRGPGGGDLDQIAGLPGEAFGTEQGVRAEFRDRGGGVSTWPSCCSPARQSASSLFSRPIRQAVELAR